MRRPMRGRQDDIVLGLCRQLLPLANQYLRLSSRAFGIGQYPGGIYGAMGE